MDSRCLSLASMAAAPAAIAWWLRETPGPRAVAEITRDSGITPLPRPSGAVPLSEAIPISSAADDVRSRSLRRLRRPVDAGGHRDRAALALDRRDARDLRAAGRRPGRGRTAPSPVSDPDRRRAVDDGAAARRCARGRPAGGAGRLRPPGHADPARGRPADDPAAVGRGHGLEPRSARDGPAPRAGPRPSVRQPRQPASAGGRVVTVLPPGGLVGLRVGPPGARALLRPDGRGADGPGPPVRGAAGRAGPARGPSRPRRRGDGRESDRRPDPLHPQHRRTISCPSLVPSSPWPPRCSSPRPC